MQKTRAREEITSPQKCCSSPFTAPWAQKKYTQQRVRSSQNELAFTGILYYHFILVHSIEDFLREA